MKNQTTRSIHQTITATMRQFKSAFAWALMLAIIWNSAAIPMGQVSTRDRRSSKSKVITPVKAAFQGQTMTVWGPQQVTQPFVPGSYTAQFPLPSGAIPPYTLTISNGSIGGTNKVTQACVKVNGVNVLAPLCYHSINPSPQVRTISLQADNTIQVTLNGPALSYVTITITANQASLAASPTSGNQGQSLSVTLTGTNTNWIAGQTTVSFGGEITVDSLTVNSATSATAQITISSTAAIGPRTITATTGSEVVTGVDAFTVNANPAPGAASSTVSTLAGSAGMPGFANGTGSAARFRNLAGLAAASNDEVIVADAGNHRIRRLDGSNTVITLAGAERGFKDGTAAQSRFADPVGMAVDGAGRVIVIDRPARSAGEADDARIRPGQQRQRADRPLGKAHDDRLRQHQSPINSDLRRCDGELQL